VVWLTRGKWNEVTANKLRRNPGRGERELQQVAQKWRLRYWVSQPIAGYFPDLTFYDCRLIVEVDGGIHWKDFQQRHDNEKDRKLRSAGWTVIRVWSVDAVANPETVLFGAFTRAFGIGNEHDAMQRCMRAVEKPKRADARSGDNARKSKSQRRREARGRGKQRAEQRDRKRAVPCEVVWRRGRTAA